jgi:endonuclease/exonuclease/phosphatase family metal-dependent hydrolase
MELKILNWNVGGAKYLELETKNEKDKFRKKLNAELKTLIKAYEDPHVICLQEIVEYNEPNKAKENIIDKQNGYNSHSSILIDKNRHPYVSKWEKVQQNGNWPNDSYFGQGNALLWRKDLPHFPVHSLAQLGTMCDGKPHVDKIILNSGLYFGSRDTEPRAALLAHFIIAKNTNDENTGENIQTPLDLFVINLHLTTLTGEREGIPKIDDSASKIRMAQLNIVLNEIVSPYNEWKRGGYRYRGELYAPGEGEDFKRAPPIWILCGDFNFTPDSEEHKMMERMNFVDHNPNKGGGTKGRWAGSERSKATITCDYIFAGPKFTSLDPRIIANNVKDNPLPLSQVKVSDHYPLYAEVDITDSAILPEDK